MRKAILAFAFESEHRRDLWESAREFAAQYATLVEPKVPGSAESSKWLEDQDEADFLLLLFAGPSMPPCAAPLEPSTRGTESGGVAGESVMPGENDWLVLNRKERETRQSHLNLLVVVDSPEQREALPADLKLSRCFDFSSVDARDALAFRLAHEPSTSLQRLWQALWPGMWRLIAAAAVVLIGLSPKVNDLLVVKLYEGAGIALQFCAGAGVLFLVFTGFFKIFRRVLPLIRRGGYIKRPFRKKLEAPIAAVAAAVITGSIFVVQILHRPSVDSVVAAQVRQWAIRLEESHFHDGGIREHRDQGKAQVWISSQALCGLLASQADWNMPKAKVRRVFTFVDRAQIGPVTLTAEQDLLTLLPIRFRQTKLKTLSARVPTFAMAIDAIEFDGGDVPLPDEAVEAIESKKEALFKVEPSLEGWGYFEQWEWGVTEIAAWVCLAQIQSLRTVNPEIWEPAEIELRHRRIRAIIDIIRERQIRESGAFSPIADTSKPTFARTYSTIMALWAMVEASSPTLHIYEGAELEKLQKPVNRAIQWLQRNVNSDHSGWKEDPTNRADTPMLGMTTQALFIIRRTPTAIVIEPAALEAFSKIERRIMADSTGWLKRAMPDNDHIHDADRYLPPTDRVIEGSTILWYPWTVAVMRTLSVATDLSAQERTQAAKLYKQLAKRSAEFSKWVDGPPESQFNYVPSEALIGFRWHVGRQTEDAN